MSYQAVEAVLATTGSRGNARCVLIALAHHANTDGACWPSVETIAAESNVSRRTAQTMLASLVADGEIVLVPNAGPRRTNLYLVTACTPQGLRSADSAGVQHAAPVQTAAGVQIVAYKESYSDLRSSYEDLRSDAIAPKRPKKASEPPGVAAPEPHATAKPKRTSTAKPKPPPDPRVRELQRALEDWQGYSACNWAAEGVAAKLIIGAGYTIDDTRAVWRSMKAEDFWQDKHLSLASVYPQLGAKLGKAGRRREVVELQPVRREVAS